MMLFGAVSYLFTLFIYAQLTTVAWSYSDKACCKRALEENAFVSLNNGAAFKDSIVCGQVYNESSPAAPDAYVTYNFCKSECGGWGVSSVENADQWAGPIVQFILPSVIFSMNIPRTFEFVSSQWPDILVLSNLRGWKRALLSLVMTFPALLFVFADTVVWVMTIMCMAGPMMVAGLHEALLDFKILEALKRRNYIPDPPRVSEEIPLNPMGDSVFVNNVAGEIELHNHGEDFDGLREKVELLVIVLAGNLRLKAYGPWTDNLVLISETLLATKGRRFNAMRSLPAQTPSDLPSSHGTPILPNTEANQNYSSLSEQLKRLMTAQSAFGAIVGAAVVFYLGAFIYTILDLLGDKSNQDAAISLAFGVEWMIIVHVAIVNGFLLASNNPSPVTMLIGRPPSTRKPREIFPPIYDGILQPVFMWRRGVNKMEWLEKSRAWRRGDQRFMNDVRIKNRDYLGWIAIPTIILISLPPAAGAVVAWQTPPRGWGCRSLCFVTYAGFQMVLTPLYFFITRKTARKTTLQRVIHYFCVMVFSVTVLLALFTSIATTLMQIIGVFRNCFCYVNSGMWLNLNNAIVNVASDTKNRRNSSDGWIVMGGVATAFMAVCSFFGCWFQMNIRVSFEDAIKDIDELF
ncbi:glycoside hydrolase family 3 [Fusarium tjaetaba]|uniref:Glycoside hydrolase family 3 n=1 Tax=Fusarium tjaetaba TaxID=1567544 RepID=A0A8H5VUV0_9HYPO|nr:glycoside hydrolase family 3 [Fusarium tjaetaba]KAF5635255.1 glycoside hydrolase family 3 [Fusarium tjaetaba]